jgi:hypothetical protein
VFGVREALIGQYRTETDAAGDPCLVLHTDVVLSPLA